MVTRLHIVSTLAVKDYFYQYFQVSLVGQEPVLYARSVSENIAYGLESEEFDFNDVISSSKLANAHDFITLQSKGYETDVGEKGAQLSGKKMEVGYMAIN